MAQTITLTLPDQFFQPLRRTAEATHRPVEQVLLAALEASLPPLDGLKKQVVENLVALESLDDASLSKALMEHVPVETQTRLQELLNENRSRALSDTENTELEALQTSADLVMLRKSRAAVLLRFRGKRVPTLAELHQLAPGGQ